MNDPVADALALSRRINTLCAEQSEKVLDLHKACSAAAQARDIDAGRQAYRQAQESLRIAQETCAQVLAAVADFAAGRSRRR